jgi:adenosylmethionine-8-amino-7-oxononanoate aminotransferase
MLIGMDANLIQLDRHYIWHPYTQAQTAPDPIPISHAKGSYLYTQDGKALLDLISSWWVNTLGHAHPSIAQAIAQQAQTLEQVIFAGFTHPPAVQLAQALAEILPTGLTRTFYSDNGSTAIEVAFKMALQYWQNLNQPQRKRFIAFEGAYHGDTVGAMSAGISSGFFDAYQSLLFSVELLPYPETWQDDHDVAHKEAASLAALEQLLESYPDEFAGLIIEPLIQGAGGMRMCRPEFLQALAQRLKQANILLIFDEVMTGFGRTGQLFASYTAKVTPDIICLSKGLTGGFLPLSVTVCHEYIYQAFLDNRFEKSLVHGHSFTANPLGCAAALAALQVFKDEQILEKLPLIYDWHSQGLNLLRDHPAVTRIRQMGTIAAFDLHVADAGYTSSIAAQLKTYFHEQGLLLRPLGNVVYLLPPYCISEADLIRAYHIIRHALDTVYHA